MLSIPSIVTREGNDIAVPLSEYERVLRELSPWVSLKVGSSGEKTGKYNNSYMYAGANKRSENNGASNNTDTDTDTVSAMKAKIAAIRAMTQNKEKPTTGANS